MATSSQMGATMLMHADTMAEQQQAQAQQAWHAATPTGAMAPASPAAPAPIAAAASTSRALTPPPQQQQQQPIVMEAAQQRQLQQQQQPQQQQPASISPMDADPQPSPPQPAAPPAPQSSMATAAVPVVSPSSLMPAQSRLDNHIQSTAQRLLAEVKREDHGAAAPAYAPAEPLHPPPSMPVKLEPTMHSLHPSAAVHYPPFESVNSMANGSGDWGASGGSAPPAPATAMAGAAVVPLVDGASEGNRRSSKRVNSIKKARALHELIRFRPPFQLPFSVESLRAAAAAAAAAAPPEAHPCTLCIKRFSEARFLHKHMHAIHGQPLDPSMVDAPGACDDADSGSPASARTPGGDFIRLLDEQLAACTAVDPPLTLIITRAKLPANVRKSLNARRLRKAQMKAQMKAVKAKPVAAASTGAAAAASPAPSSPALLGGATAPAASPLAGIGASSSGSSIKKKKKVSSARKGVSNRFGEYEGSSDSDEDGHYTAADIDEERMLDWIADEAAQDEQNTPAKRAKAERAKQRVQARAAAKNNPAAGSASAPPLVGSSSGNGSASAASSSPLTDFQRQQMDLANFGVDGDSSDSGDVVDGGDGGGGAGGEDGGGALDEEDDDESRDPSCRANEQERMKLHASMELADRRSYDQLVQHEMNETYGFADSNPRTMILSRDSMLIKLDLMDILNNGVLQFFSEQQLETLKSLLPSCDQTKEGLNATFISPIFMQSLYEYQELLTTGSLDPDLRETRNVVSSRRRREQHDAWKDRNFERYWGEVLSSKGTTKDNAKTPSKIYWKPSAMKKEFKNRQTMEGLLHRVIHGDIFAFRRRKQLLKAEGRWPLPSLQELQAQRDSGLAASIYVPSVVNGVIGVQPKPRNDRKRKTTAPAPTAGEASGEAAAAAASSFTPPSSQLFPAAAASAVPLSDSAMDDAIFASVARKRKQAQQQQQQGGPQPASVWSQLESDDDDDDDEALDALSDNEGPDDTNAAGRRVAPFSAEEDHRDADYALPTPAPRSKSRPKSSKPKATREPKKPKEPRPEGSAPKKRKSASQAPPTDITPEQLAAQGDVVSAVPAPAKRPRKPKVQQQAPPPQSQDQQGQGQSVAAPVAPASAHEAPAPVSGAPAASAVAASAPATAIPVPAPPASYPYPPQSQLHSHAGHMQAHMQQAGTGHPNGAYYGAGAAGAAAAAGGGFMYPSPHAYAHNPYPMHPSHFHPQMQQLQYVQQQQQQQQQQHPSLPPHSSHPHAPPLPESLAPLSAAPVTAVGSSSGFAGSSAAAASHSSGSGGGLHPQLQMAQQMAQMEAFMKQNPPQAQYMQWLRMQLIMHQQQQQQQQPQAQAQAQQQQQ